MKVAPGPQNRKSNLKVLVLDEEIPYPPNAGKRIRTWNLLRRLARSHSICLLSYGRLDSAATEAVKNAGIRSCLVEPPQNSTSWRLYPHVLLSLLSPHPYSVVKHYSSRFEKKLKQLLADEHWDLIQCEWTPYARFIATDCGVPVLVTTHNVESDILARRASQSSNLVPKIFFRDQERRMRRFEKEALRKATAVTAVSMQDVETFRSWGFERVRLVPNGVDVGAYRTGPTICRDNELLFLASLDWFPNIDALDHFIDDILPIIRSRRPTIKLRVVGRRPSEQLKERCAQIPGIEFVGEVDDVASHLARASIVVVPLRIGGGSRLKILEAMAAGKAIVSTSIGAEGLDVVPGKHLLIADSPREFAACTEQLLDSKEMRQHLGLQGRRLVERAYDWSRIARRLEDSWYEITGRGSTLKHDAKAQSA